MAIEKLTLFELHFDGAQFGPRRLDTDTSVGDETPVETDSPELAEETDSQEQAEETGGRRFLALATASVVLAVGATLIARRLFGEDEQTTVDEFAEEPVDSEAIEVEGEDTSA